LSFEIKLPLFEGPFDLLLFFIERDELDIYDIPIAKITNDFLDYLKHLENLNVEVASEFILVASTLMRIKAKMLLPRPQIDEEGNEIDPRDELVKHLLEYKKYKSVIAEFSAMEGDMQQKEKRGNVVKEVQHLAETINVEAELQNVDMYKLLNVYRNVMARYALEQNKPKHRVVQYPYSISEQKEYILKKVSHSTKLAFTTLIEDNPSKVAVIFNFLAILELLQSALIDVVVGEGFNNFWLEQAAQEA